jgi:serine/threonine protein phosphatase PrpC
MEAECMTPERAAGQCSAGGLEVCWVSDLGVGRENNEDACLALPEKGLLIVSDGMGGEYAGELASRLVVEWLPALVAEQVGGVENPSVHDVEAGLREAVVILNHRVRIERSTFAGSLKMGATVAMALVRGALAHLAHMGDSRCYLWRDGRLERLTRDHSVVGTLLERGAITPEQSECHPLRGQLARYVGMGGEVRADVRTVELRDGDRLLLCTDGLTDALPDDVIQDLLGRHEEVSLACQALVAAARSRDNITVLIARWREQ